ncbi:hypothetical protein QJS66_21200 [Kocuria rhizophila]|nr:hypothetical protein QJS66_21200 [Kocuria rhizophila]
MVRPRTAPCSRTPPARRRASPHARLAAGELGGRHRRQYPSAGRAL